MDENKVFLYYVLTNLLLSSLLALVYTNDMFTAYVFVEINTISACGLIMIRQVGRTIEAAVRYMIMSLLGSGLLLLGLCMMYDLTGHLLMSNMKEALAVAFANEQFQIPLVITIGMICIGLAIKSEFGVTLAGPTKEVREHFKSVATLADFIRSQQKA